jgi:aspartyl-tRNA(Asn)/glutamyl-tRNA(Gln) amidotransferase subunit A
MPIIAPRFDEIKKLTPLENYNMDKLTIGPNMSGIPTISIPIGTIESMPIGMQIIGDHYNESKIIKIAAVAERNLNGN